MGFLSQLLPGLRESRPSFLPGFIWIAAIWMTFGHLVDGDYDPGSVPDIVSTAFNGLDLLGKTVVLAVVAWLLGTISRSVTDVPTNALTMLRNGTRMYLDFVRSIRLNPFNRDNGSRQRSTMRQYRNSSRLSQRMLNRISLTETRLPDQDPPSWAVRAIDDMRRDVAEVELRYTMVPPLTALLAATVGRLVLSSDLPSVWLLLLVPVVVLGQYMITLLLTGGGSMSWGPVYDALRTVNFQLDESGAGPILSPIAGRQVGLEDREGGFEIEPISLGMRYELPHEAVLRDRPAGEVALARQRASDFATAAALGPTAKGTGR